MSKYDLAATDAQAQRLSVSLAEQLHGFAAPLLSTLDALLDARLVRTLLATLEAVLAFRSRAHGLLLSELGAFLAETPEHAPAGTKRLSNLLRSPKWTSAAVEDFLWRMAGERLDVLAAANEPALMLWDESVVEKPESLKSEGLCAVRSSHAKRRTRIKPGFYQPPTTRPIFVPGLNWLSVLVIGMSGAPTVAAMRWFTARGKEALVADAKQVRAEMLERCAAEPWFTRVLHVFDRGYAGSPWLSKLAATGARFVVRWPKHYKLVGGIDGEKKPAWHITRGKRSLDTRLMRDAAAKQERMTGVYWTHVEHPDWPSRTLYLVVARSGKAGAEPWYLLTSETVQTASDAWRIVSAYSRRWQIEMSFRYNKSELALQSPRLWTWERRVKLMMIVTVAYAFLLSLLDAKLEVLKNTLLKAFCPRTGKRSRQTPAPLYRIRAALAALMTRYPHPKPQSSG